MSEFWRGWKCPSCGDEMADTGDLVDEEEYTYVNDDGEVCEDYRWVVRCMVCDWVGYEFSTKENE